MFKLLTEKQVLFVRDMPEVIKKNNGTAEPTDLAVILGAMTCGDERTCAYWTDSQGGNGKVRGAMGTGLLLNYSPEEVKLCLRPVLPKYRAEELFPDDIELETHKGPDGVTMIYWGEYPQTVVGDKTAQALDDMLKTDLSGKHKTGKKYTFNRSPWWEKHARANIELETPRGFEPVSYEEYAYEGKKYVRIAAYNRDYDNEGVLSTGEKVNPQKPYWIRVEPIEWFKDPTGLWVAKKGLVSGMRFCSDRRYNGCFCGTIVDQYLNTFFAQEMKPSKSRLQSHLKKASIDDKDEPLVSSVKARPDALTGYYSPVKAGIVRVVQGLVR